MNTYSHSSRSSLQARRRAEDLRWLKKAKHRIQTTLVLAYALILIFPFATYFVLAQQVFTKPSFFNTLYLLVLLVSIVVWLVIFFLAGSGKKASKTLFTLALLGQFAFSFWLLWDMFQHVNYLTFYLAWFTLSMVENIFLLFIKRKIYDSWASSVFFDHVLILDDDQREAQQERERRMEMERYQYEQRQRQAEMARRQSMQQSGARPSTMPGARPMRQMPPQRSGVYEYSRPDFSSNRELEAKNRIERERQARKTLSARYPRTAIRMAIGIYGELIVFPVVTHIFQNSFVSIDNSSVFAVGLMFSLCILTAMVWTIPILFCYLKYPGVKKAVYAALFGQLLILAWGIYSLYAYYKSDAVIYAHNVFLMFIIFEVVRYAILLIAVFPAFRLPEIEDSFDDMDEEGSSRSALSFLKKGMFKEEESGPAFELYEDDQYEEPDEDGPARSSSGLRQALSSRLSSIKDGLRKEEADDDEMEAYDPDLSEEDGSVYDDSYESFSDEAPVHWQDSLADDYDDPDSRVSISGYDHQDSAYDPYDAPSRTTTPETPSSSPSRLPPRRRRYE